MDAQDELRILDDETACGMRHERRKGCKQCPKEVQRRRFGCKHRTDCPDPDDEFHYSIHAPEDLYRVPKSEVIIEEQNTAYHDYIDELLQSGRLNATEAEQYKKQATELHSELTLFDYRSNGAGPNAAKPVVRVEAEQRILAIEEEQGVVIQKLKTLRDLLLEMGDEE